MKYSEVEQYINNIPKFTKKNSMDHTKRFMELLEIKEKNRKIIHVAGTNGKGSTCAYMNAILCAEGKTVGMFTSPHLEYMTERIRINGKEISQEEFVEVYHQVMKVVAIMSEEGLPHPTFFEFLLGMAMKAYERANLEYVILETGLGGRMDATNVFQQPVATVITSIGLDHVQYLGNTITQIAGEKAGIIKKYVPVIYDGTEDEASIVIEDTSAKCHCKCKKIADSAYEILKKTEKYIAFSMKDEYDKHVTWEIRTYGNYQVANAALALTTLMEVLPQEDYHYDIWERGLLDMNWPGRMEEIEPGVFIDGAHNVSAIQAVTKEYKKYDVLLFSAVEDKNYEEMLDIICENIEVNSYVVTTIDDSRGVPAEKLADLLRQRVKNPIYVEETIEEAWGRLQEQKSEKGQALCLGSLYLVGMVKDLCNTKKSKSGEIDQK